MNFASGLAFNLIVTLIPITIALIALSGFIYGRLDLSIQQEIISFIQHSFPPPIPSTEIVRLALNTLNSNAGLLGIIATGIAIIAGSGLFLAIEDYFAIIYQTRTRDLLQRYIMAIGMIFLFVVLTPLVLLADTLSTLISSLLQTTPISSGFFNTLLGILTGIVAGWVLLVIIYIVVPHRSIRFRHCWLGALLASVAIQAYLLLFPFYVTRFLSDYTGVLGFAVIFLFFFYYFALILLIGAEINAYFGEGIPATTDNLSVRLKDQVNQER